MFEELTYVGYTALFCLPPLVLIWLRAEFFAVLSARWRPILASTLAIAAYGRGIWPLALEWGCWSYRADRITGVKLFGWVWLDDVLWWLLVSFLLSSFFCLSAHYEERGIDIVLREIRGLARSFANAFRGFRVVPLERNSTIHVAAATFVLLEAALFRVGRLEWIAAAIASGLVLGFEILNSSLERIASRGAGAGDGGARGAARGPGDPLYEEIRLIKDAAAAGVLVSAAAAAAVGLLIFGVRTFEALG